jgi:hypothetical protein
MTKELFYKQKRQLGTIAIESKVAELALRTGLAGSKCVWNLGQDMDHSGPHRLDICINNRISKVYLTDHEIAAYAGKYDRYHIEPRLQYAVSKLLEEEQWH